MTTLTQCPNCGEPGEKLYREATRYRVLCPNCGESFSGKELSAAAQPTTLTIAARACDGEWLAVGAPIGSPLAAVSTLRRATGRDRLRTFVGVNDPGAFPRWRDAVCSACSDMLTPADWSAAVPVPCDLLLVADPDEVQLACVRCRRTEIAQAQLRMEPGAFDVAMPVLTDRVPKPEKAPEHPHSAADLATAMGASAQPTSIWRFAMPDADPVPLPPECRIPGCGRPGWEADSDRLCREHALRQIGRGGRHRENHQPSATASAPDPRPVLTLYCEGDW